MGEYVMVATVFLTVAFLLSQVSRAHHACASATVALLPFREEGTDCCAGAGSAPKQKLTVANRTDDRSRSWPAAELEELRLRHVQARGPPVRQQQHQRHARPGGTREQHHDTRPPRRARASRFQERLLSD